MPELTRKQAVFKAIDLLGQMPDTDEIHSIRAKLKELADDMPLTAWSESAVFDTLNQFALDNKRNPTVTDLKQKGMPPHTVIKHRFGITAKEFLNKHYPPKCTSKIYRDKTDTQWAEIFIDDYKKIKPKSGEEYNAKRRGNSPSWQTIASFYNIRKWSRLKEHFKLPAYYSKRRRKEYGAKEFILEREDNLTDTYMGLRACLVSRL